MRTRSGYLAILLLLLAALAIYSPASANVLVNGDFEKSSGSQVPGWQVKGKVEARKTGGKAWQRFQARFNSGDQTEVQVFFEVKQGSTGSLWIDNFKPSGGLTVANPSFEEAGADGKLAGWSVAEATTSLDTAMKSDGSRSLKISHKNEAVPTTSVMQRLTVEPNKQYRIDMDIALSDDFGGEGRMLIFSAAGSYSMQENLEELMVSELTAMRDRCGEAMLEILPAQGEPVSLQQMVKTTPNQNLSLSLDVQRRGFAGSVKITASDTGTGAVLKSVTLDAKRDQWETVALPLVSKSGKVSLSIVADGSGKVRLDNVDLGLPQVMPDLQKVNWLPSTENYKLPAKLGATVEGLPDGALSGAMELVTKDLAKLGVEFGVGSGVTVKVGPKYVVKGKGSESYMMGIDRKGIRISAGTQSGAFYGLMTLLQLISSQDGQAYATACEVTDYPDFPVRGMMYADAEQIARWKCNLLFYSSGYPDTPKDRADLGATIAEATEFNLKLAPFMLGLHGGYYVEGKNPNLAVGIWQKDEPITLSGTSDTPLKNPWVIRTGLTDVTLKSADGSTIYEIGKDYTVIDGDMHYNYDQASPKPFAVARTAASRIPDGASVLASYDYVSHYRDAMPGRKETHIPYCFEEPQVKQLMTDYVKTLVSEFKLEYINVAHDLEEFGPAFHMIATDSRTIKAGKTPVGELVGSVNLCASAAKQGSEKVESVLWAGNVNPFSKEAAPGISKDLIVNVWGYDAMFPNGPGKEAIEFWTKYDHQTMGLAWYNLRNVRGWAQIIDKARKKGYPCIGLVGSAWADLPYEISSGGLMETARVSWRVPRKGEKGWVEVPEMADLGSR